MSRGSVRRRGATWTWYLDVDADPLTGKRRIITKGGFLTRRAAEQALEEALAARRKGRLARPSRLTLAGYLEGEWLPAVRPRLRPSTRANYATYTRAYVTPVIGAAKLHGLTPTQLNRFYAHLLDEGRRRGDGGLAPKTVRNIHAMLHRALRDAVRWGHLARNVAEAADPPTGGSPEMQVWTPEQLRAFLGHVRDDRLYALWLLVATTGMRRGELAGLRWSDVDFGNARVSPRRPRVVADHQVHESNPKTAKGRRVLALDAATLAALREHRERQAAERELVGIGPAAPDGLVFTWPDGAPLHPDLVTGWFKGHVRRAGLPAIRLHDVRHSYATAALAAGVPVKVISERLGHATVAFTMDVYGHVIPGMDQAAADAVAGLILGPEAAPTLSNGEGPADATASPFVDTPVDNLPGSHDQGEEVTGEPPAQ